MTPDTFTSKVELLRHELYTYVYRQLWDKSLCEDTFSQAILTAWEKIEGYQEGSNFRAWLYQICTYKCYSTNKKQQLTKHASLDQLREIIEPEDGRRVPFESDNWLQDCDEVILSALGELKEDERTCFLLRASSDFSYKEISDTLSLPIGTVMTHLFRARKKMQALLFDYIKREGFTRNLKEVKS